MGIYLPLTRGLDVGAYVFSLCYPLATEPDWSPGIDLSSYCHAVILARIRVSA
jgi:hypothetical protein